MTAKANKEIREHPERFDYADLPNGKALKPAHAKQLDEREPKWLKKMLADRTKAD